MDANTRFFIHSLYHYLRFNWNKVRIIIFALFIGTVVSAAFLNVSFDITQKLHHELKVYGANFILIPQAGKDLENKLYNDAVASIPKTSLKAISPFLYSTLSLESNTALVAGVDFESIKMIEPFLQATQGYFGSSVFDEESIFIGSTLAKTLELKPNDKITLTNPTTQNTQNFVIKGIITNGGEFDGIALIAITAMQNLCDTHQIHYAKAVLYGDIDSINNLAMSMTNETISAKPIMQVAASEGNILTKLQSLMFLICIVVLLIASLSVNSTLSAVIFARKKQIALHLSLGASSKNILRLLGAEVAIMCIIAILLGAVAGFGLANILGWVIFDAAISFRVLPFVLTIIIAVLFSTLSAYYPIKKALKINITTNLKGE